MPLPSASPKLPVARTKAVAAFLKEMVKAAKRTLPAWQNTLTAGLDECPLSFDQRRAVFEIHPLDDFYFAGVVALEAVRVRELFSGEEADDVLAIIGDEVDAAAGRSDRLVSDLVFTIINRIEHVVTPESQKMPYDQVVKVILERLGINQLDATRHLMTHTLYRHSLGEPLALGVPHWWNGFAKKYALAESEDIPTGTTDVKTSMSVAGLRRRRAPRRSVAFQ